MFAADTLQIWFTFAIIGLAVVSYVSERISMELTSVLVIVALLVFFELHPLVAENGANVLDAPALLAGFANPALVTIIALLVIGQGLYHTAALERPTRQLAYAGRRRPLLTLSATLVGAGVLSAFLNNTPVVVMFIPVLSALAARLNVSPAKLLIPLSFISILGGMTTVIGSSTNLLVSGMVSQVGLMELGFFDFAVPGLLLALVGSVYVGLCVPRLLPEREPLASEATGLSGKQFIAQISVTADHPLNGAEPIAGLFPALKNMTVRLVQRGDMAILPPFEDVRLRPGDYVIVAATRQALTDVLLSGEGLLTTDLPVSDDEPSQVLDGSGAELTLCETVIAPSSTLIGRRIGQSGLRTDTGCLVLGIQRRSRMMRGRLEDIRLEPGDSVLLLGPRSRIRELRTNRDLLLLEWSAHELPDINLANRARLIFAATVLLAATGLMPIVVAALAGAAAMIPAGCLNMRQAARAVDRRIFLLIGAAIAMALALEKTGTGQMIAHAVITSVGGGHPALVLSALFLLIAVMTNFLSNNATALLFTPIAASTALELGVDAKPFIFAVIFAANCSFATPMGYQTNLLVMGPGRYKYLDYTRTGAPLIVLLWICYSIFAPWYYGL
ncbi:MAG: SLC13 family permease [Pseudomonadota bacterium]